eukprot:CFRG4027T1
MSGISDFSDDSAGSDLADEHASTANTAPSIHSSATTTSTSIKPSTIIDTRTHKGAGPTTAIDTTISTLKSKNGVNPSDCKSSTAKRTTAVDVGGTTKTLTPAQIRVQEILAKRRAAQALAAAKDAAANVTSVDENVEDTKPSTTAQTETKLAPVSTTIMNNKPKPCTNVDSKSTSTKHTNSTSSKSVTTPSNATEFSITNKPPAQRSVKTTTISTKMDTTPSHQETKVREPTRAKGLNAFVEKKHRISERQGVLRNANKANTKKLASGEATVTLFDRLASDNVPAPASRPKVLTIEERQGHLHSTDKEHVAKIDTVEATKALFGRLVDSQPAQHETADGGWSGGWGGWASSAWTQASSAVSGAATAMLLDGPGQDSRSDSPRARDVIDDGEKLVDDDPVSTLNGSSKPNRQRDTYVDPIRAMRGYLRPAADFAAGNVKSISENVTSGVSTAAGNMLSISENLNKGLTSAVDGVDKVDVSEVMETGLGALERLGKTTMSFLADTHPHNATENTHDWQDDKSNHSHDDHLDSSPTHDSRFERHNGMEVLGALEETSQLFSGAAQRQLVAMKQASRAKVDDHMEKVLTVLDIEVREEENTVPIDSVMTSLVNFGVQESDFVAMVTVVEESKEWLENLLDESCENDKIIGSVENYSEGGYDTPSVEELDRKVRLCLARCVDDMALLVVCMIKVLVASAEGIGGKLNSQRGEDENHGLTQMAILETATLIRNVGVWAMVELIALSESYNNAIITLKDKAVSTCANSVESNKTLAVLEDRVELGSTSIYLEAGNASAKTYEVIQLMIPIFRMLMTNVE